MEKPLNHPSFRFYIGEWGDHAESDVSLKIQTGKCEARTNPPILSAFKLLSMPFGKAEARLQKQYTLPVRDAACCSNYQEASRRNHNFIIRRHKGGGDYSVTSTHSTFLSTKIHMEKKKHHENK